MKLNWFSPVPPTRSAIAVVSAAVLPALAKRAEVTLWVHERSWSRELEKYARVRRYSPDRISWKEINAADATIYHIGNHPEFHGPIWQISRQHPGIVILHDLSLQHFFAGMVAQRIGLTAGEYCELMRLYHPESGPAAARAVLSGERSAEEICDDCPLTGAALEDAIGVGVHSQAGYSRLKDSAGVPVAYIPLFGLPDDNPSSDEQELDRLKRSSLTSDTRAISEPAKYKIIMFGFLGANRRLDSILTALRDFPEKDRFRLDIYGTIENRKRVLRMIKRFGLKRIVKVHGFVSERELAGALRSSDLALNLRNPTMGEASASQLRIWQYGLPSLVSDVGWYAAIPKNTVALVRADAEVEDIQKHLANFLRDPEAWRELGRNGRRYVDEHHTVEAYVQSLMELVEASLRDTARQAVLWMARRSGRTIKPWFSEEATTFLLPPVAETISNVFDERRRET